MQIGEKRKKEEKKNNNTKPDKKYKEMRERCGEETTRVPSSEPVGPETYLHKSVPSARWLSWPQDLQANL